MASRRIVAQRIGHFLMLIVRVGLLEAVLERVQGAFDRHAETWKVGNPIFRYISYVA